MNDIQTFDLKTYFNGLFEEEHTENNIVKDLKSQGIRNFDRLGFPTTKHEEWKYTNLAPVIKQRFDFNDETDISQEEVEQFFLKNIDAEVLVFINGKFSKNHSQIKNTDHKIVIKSLKEAIDSNNDVVEKYLGKILDIENDALSALNTSFINDGVFIQIGDNKIVEKQILIYHISTSATQNSGSQPRNLFIIGKNSTVTVVEKFDNIGENASFTNNVSEIFVHENAGMDYYKIQNENEKAFHIGTTQVHQLKDSRFSATTISLNGSLIRNNLNIALDAENCEAHMYGLYMLAGKQHVDNHTLVDHRKPNCYSNELYKGILDGKSTGVFNGKIFVREDAQKTNAFQSNKNIILSPEAAINTKPQLEIFADDVKCSHGATVGQLDESMMFYMQARGISKEKAKILLMEAFANEVVANIKLESLKSYLEEAIIERLEK